MKAHLLPVLFLLGCFCGWDRVCAAADWPEPGPENYGMRLRWVVEPELKGTNESYRVRVDLINVTDRPIKLLGDWPDDYYTGDYREYLAADISIRTEPPIMHWVGQVQATGAGSNAAGRNSTDARTE